MPEWIDESLRDVLMPHGARCAAAMRASYDHQAATSSVGLRFAGFNAVYVVRIDVAVLAYRLERLRAVASEVIDGCEAGEVPVFGIVAAGPSMTRRTPSPLAIT